MESLCKWLSGAAPSIKKPRLARHNCHHPSLPCSSATESCLVCSEMALSWAPSSPRSPTTATAAPGPRHPSTALDPGLLAGLRASALFSFLTPAAFCRAQVRCEPAFPGALQVPGFKQCFQKCSLRYLGGHISNHIPFE